MPAIELTWQTVPVLAGGSKALQLLPDQEEIKRLAARDAARIEAELAALALAQGNPLNPDNLFHKYPDLPPELQMKIIAEALRGSILRVLNDGSVVGDKKTDELTNLRIRALSKVSKQMSVQVRDKTVIYSGCTFQFRTPTAFYNFFAQLSQRESCLIRSVEFYIYHTFHIDDYTNEDKDAINSRHRVEWIKVCKAMPWSVEHIILNLHQGRDNHGKWLGMRDKNPNYIIMFIQATRGKGVRFEYRGVGRDALDVTNVQKLGEQPITGQIATNQQ
ncbi:MAG: hypothetical protein M1812_001699 [Candelaria pacifica]|nr:MAG: hypothetical protein M1812_001699 [Candelaria pacifica]